MNIHIRLLFIFFLLYLLKTRNILYNIIDDLTRTIGTAGMDAVRPRSIMVVDLRLPNIDDLCKLLLGELPDVLARNDRLVDCLVATGGRTNEAVEGVRREGEGLRN